MKLVVGLGNPGKKYQGTRHNIGFEVIRVLVDRYITDKPKSKFSGEYYEALIGSKKVLLVLPLTYMNLSGNTVLPLRDFYKVPNEEILVVCDDVNLPLGRIRIRENGSAGGQNGLKDILRRLGTQAVPRLRVGIAGKRVQEDSGGDLASYVLGRFSKEEAQEVQQVVRRAADGIESWISEGISACMHTYNTAPKR
ncbi:MAG: aminoacyl-tRNA hydrolase [Pirellulaceae bacterium]|nr:aminoacyl-tRNA hydrolase [Pirellulaceae bacterium]